MEQKTMRSKIFQGFGEAGVNKIEADINRWLDDPANEHVSVVRSDMTAASVGPAEDRYQNVIVLVWYVTGDASGVRRNIGVVSGT